MSNFRRLVLGCIDSYDSEQRRILQHFSRSTRFASFCTILISEILQICVKILLIFAEISQKFSKILQKSEKIRKFSRKNLRKICKIGDWSGAKECSWYRHPCLAELRAASTRHSSVGRTATPCNISLIVLVACLFAGAVLFARALLRRGLFVGIFQVVFHCGFYTWDSKGAKECKSCRSRKMQKNASLLSIVAVDTAENEPAKV